MVWRARRVASPRPTDGASFGSVLVRDVGRMRSKLSTTVLTSRTDSGGESSMTKIGWASTLRSVQLQGLMVFSSHARKHCCNVEPKRRRKLALQSVWRNRSGRHMHGSDQISEPSGAGNEQTWESVSCRRTVVRWVLIERRREPFVGAPCLEGETGSVSSFSEEQVLASLFGQPTQGHEEVCMRNGRSDINGADSSNGVTNSMVEPFEVVVVCSRAAVALPSRRCQAWPGFRLDGSKIFSTSVDLESVGDRGRCSTFQQRATHHGCMRDIWRQLLSL